MLLLPLMWLALTATVYGWREFRARDVLAGTRAQARIERLERGADIRWVRLALLASDDLRTKYLPVAQAFRLILRAGPRLVGAYVLLATVISLLDNLAAVGLTVLVGPRSPAVSLLLDPLSTLVVGLVITCISVALYAAAFDRALDAVLTAARPRLPGRTATTGSAMEFDQPTSRVDRSLERHLSGCRGRHHEADPDPTCRPTRSGSSERSRAGPAISAAASAW